MIECKILRSLIEFNDSVIAKRMETMRYKTCAHKLFTSLGSA